MAEASFSKALRFKIEIEVDEDGRYIAECVDLPGCVSDGETEEEALDNIADAIRGYLASMAKHARSEEGSRVRVIEVEVVAAVGSVSRSVR